MKTYARIQQGIVAEIIPPMQYDADNPAGIALAWKLGDEVPIERRYTPDLVSTMVDITSVSPQPQQGWSYDGKVFTAPSTKTV
ncbi:hypothetical protein AB4Y32_15890 [Paraburkholderia phymatum]|uniref:Uncharacterized protein n=1 Tax=Paraburkholderia phymatum TaxID=148447 RepID=A0ACC6U113_9BURK